MGYFPNGTAGDIYEAEYCDRCVHRGDENEMCPVWFLHLLWDYDPDEEKKAALDLFIPRKNCFNEQCKMFYEKFQ